MLLTKKTARKHQLPKNKFLQEPIDPNAATEKDKDKLEHTNRKAKPVMFKKLTKVITSKLLTIPLQCLRMPIIRGSEQPYPVPQS